MNQKLKQIIDNLLDGSTVYGTDGEFLGMKIKGLSVFMPNRVCDEGNMIVATGFPLFFLINEKSLSVRTANDDEMSEIMNKM